ncbi:hypothetical protein AVZ31_22940 [Mycolicibacterium neoaurum]|uniref:Tape measure protein n=1 Tax=Mycolicibacterium neoaurum VKM Ac-1815D TaxID=700508 RepID=V5XJJ1_MYCNE|nr:hypothetical protein DXK33_05860 [Mycolicibacterium neoaurum]KUM06143.1 hypothetical protein AVZ31_22940 [Mycolicibacterium neoaurum]
MDVFTRLNERRVRQDARTLVDEFDSAGERAGKNFGENLSAGIERSAPRAERAAARMERSTDRVADSLGRVNVEQAKYDELSKKSTASDRQKIQQAEALAKAHRAYAASVRDAARATQEHLRIQRSAESSSSIGGDGPASSLRNTTTAMAALGGAARSPAAIAAVAPVLLQIGSAAVAATGSLLVLPGVLGAVGAAFGSLKLATSGFFDAIENVNDPEKFAESLRSLSPNAQQAALSIQSLMPALTELKTATQDALFADIGPGLERLTTAMLPQIQQLTTTVAASFNQMFDGVSNTLLSNPVLTGQITQNFGQAFQNLTPAAASLTQALTSLIAVGSTFLPDLARGASEAAAGFADMIEESARSGELQATIRDGITIVGMLIDATKSAGEMFGALATDGVAAMADIKLSVEAVSTVIRIASGDLEAWGDVFPTIGKMAAGTFADIGNSIDTHVLGPLRWVVDTLNELPGVSLPEIPDFQFTNEGFSARSSSPIPGTNTPGFAGTPALGGEDNASRRRRGLAPVETGEEAARRRVAGLPPAGRFLPSGQPGGWWPGLGVNGQPGGGFYTIGQEGYRAGMAPDWRTAGSGGGSGPRLPDAPVLPYEPRTSTAPTAALFSAENSLYDAQHTLAEKRARLTQLESTSTATAEDVQDARNDVREAEQAEHEAQLRLNEARMSATEKGIKQLNSASDQLGDVGAKLDRDFGLSRGLPGLAENLIKFVASLAAAGPMAQLGAIAAASPSQGGYGAMGILGAQGAFGDRFTGIDPQRMYGGGYGPSGIGPAAIGGGMGYGAYPGDAALLANVPSGRYTQEERGDLTQGLADCSSAVEDLVNMLDGRPTGGASMTTYNADEWLQSRGFLPGMGGPGDMRVGFNPEHMQATLPGGTPFNWGSKEAAARGGVGGTGAYDPSFTSHYYRPATGGVPSLTPRPALAPSPSLSTSGVPSSAALNSDPALTNPALTPDRPASGPAALPPLGSVPSSGGPLSTGMPQSPFLGAPAGPGAGEGAGATPIGGLAPPGGSGGGGAVGLTGGGAIGLGMQAGGMALDVMAPGAGQAAQTVVKLGSRAIEFGSQVGGIAASGAMETLLPTGGSELANNNWATKLAGGFAGMGPALPNTAGGKSAAQLAGQPGQNDQNAPNETNNNYDVKIDAAARDSGGLMRDFEYHTTAAAAAPGM